MTFLAIFEQMMKTTSRIPFSSAKYGKCPTTLFFGRVRSWSSGFHVVPRSSYRSDLAMQKLYDLRCLLSLKMGQFILCYSLDIFASYVLFTNRIVTAIEPCAANLMVYGFHGDPIAFGKECHDALFLQHQRENTLPRFKKTYIGSKFRI